MESTTESAVYKKPQSSYVRHFKCCIIVISLVNGYITNLQP